MTPTKKLQRTVNEWGQSILTPESLFELMYTGRFDSSAGTFFCESSPALDQYNEICKQFDKTAYMVPIPKTPEHSPDEEHERRAQRWLVDDAVQDIDVRSFLLSMCETDEQRKRVRMEMDMFEERKLEPLLRAMIYLVDCFRQNGILWGVGRGSSVASYCLYLIGVHRIDPMKYNLDINEFLK